MSELDRIIVLERQVGKLVDVIEAQTILEMIEAVDPADAGKLDEIDKAVAIYVGYKPYGVKTETDALSRKTQSFEMWESPVGEIDFWHPDYTRSRDALKAIRPDGWILASKVSRIKSTVSIYEFVHSREGRKGQHFKSPRLYTEELAELHAIVQAIAYEREQNND